MASLDSSLSEADRMAQGACDGAGTTGPDYVSSGDFIGTGPDSARHIINYCNYSYFSAFPPYEVLTTSGRNYARFVIQLSRVQLQAS